MTGSVARPWLIPVLCLALSACATFDRDREFTCETEATCAYGYYCFQDKCTRLCSEGGTCPQGFGCGDQGRCVEECSCEQGQDCVDGKCLPCRKEEDCGGKMACFAGDCLARCDKGQPCGEDELCNGALCMGKCEQDVDCAQGKTCWERACFPSCQEDPDCGDFYQCVSGACLCRTPHKACPGGTVCHGGICLEECSNDEPCGAGWMECPDDTCLPQECEVDSDCPGSDQDVLCNTQARWIWEPSCTTTCRTQERGVDGSCPFGMRCVNGYSLKGCIPRGNKRDGEECASSDECLSGVCVQVSPPSFCSNLCNIPEQSGCEDPSGELHCTDIGLGLDGFCLPGGDKTIGMACEQPSFPSRECETAICLPGNKDSSFCTIFCDPVIEGVCDAMKAHPEINKVVCTSHDMGGETFSCLPVNTRGNVGGQSCDYPMDCRSGHCFDNICSILCCTDQERCCPDPGKCSQVVDVDCATTLGQPRAYCKPLDKNPRLGVCRLR